MKDMLLDVVDAIVQQIVWIALLAVIAGAGYLSLHVCLDVVWTD